MSEHAPCCIGLDALDPIGKLRAGKDQAGELLVAEPDAKVSDRDLRA